MSETKPAQRHRIQPGVALLGLGYLTSMVLVFAVYWWGLPWLAGALPGPVIALLATSLLLPAVSAIAVMLQRRAPCSLKSFCVLYLEDLVALLFDVACLLGVVPMVLLDLTILWAGLVGLALLVGLGLWVAQMLSGRLLGIRQSPGEMLVLVLVLGGIFVVMLGLYWLKRRLDRGGQHMFDRLVGWHNRVKARIRQHRPELPQKSNTGEAQ